MPPERSGYLTDFAKGQIVALKEINLSFSQIGRLLHCPKSIAQSFHNWYQMMGAKNHPFTGTPKIMDTRTWGYLGRASKRGCHVPLSELGKEVVPHASYKTMKRALTCVNTKKWRDRKRQFLKVEHAIKRLAWAKEDKN